MDVHTSTPLVLSMRNMCVSLCGTIFRSGGGWVGSLKLLSSRQLVCIHTKNEVAECLLLSLLPRSSLSPPGHVVPRRTDGSVQPSFSLGTSRPTARSKGATGLKESVESSLLGDEQTEKSGAAAMTSERLTKES